MRRNIVWAVGILLAVLAVIHVYIGWNIVLFLEAWGADGFGWLAGTALAVLAVAYLLGRLGQAVMPGALTDAVKSIGSLWLACIQYLLLLLPVADLVGWIAALAGADADRSVRWIGGAVLLVLLVLFAFGTRNAWSPVVRRYELDIDKRAGDRSRLRVMVASDLHLGTIVGNRHIRRLLEQAERIRPDLILLAGDVLDDDLGPFLRKDMKSVLGRLRAPLGVYAVLGNHEYYGGHIDRYVEVMREIGIPVLRDEVVELEGGRIVIAGRKDKTAETADPEGRLPLEELLRDVDPQTPILLMDHQPYGLDRAEACGVDVMVSGHTHRGQLAPNHLITRRLFELDWGYKRKGRLHAVVSSGFGTWGPPLRIGSRSEVIQLDIRFQG